METNVKAVELRELWRRYKEDGDESARERLVVAYSPLVKFIAGRMASGLPSPRRGIRPHLLRPARADRGDRALRSRSARSSSRPSPSPASRARSSTSSARSTGCRARFAPALATSRRRMPSSRRSCSALPPTRRWRRSSTWASTSSRTSLLEIAELVRAGPRRPVDVRGPGGQRRRDLGPRHDPRPERGRPGDRGAGSELKDRLADAIESLPERERLVVALYYYENLTLREIGEVLGVTESRVSQLHTKAVLALRPRFATRP